MNKIEQVARALAKIHSPDAIESFNAGSISRIYWYTLAKAAIQAMREPTDEMTASTVNATTDISYDDVYKLYIDVALKE